MLDLVTHARDLGVTHHVMLHLDQACVKDKTHDMTHHVVLHFVLVVGVMSCVLSCFTACAMCHV